MITLLGRILLVLNGFLCGWTFAGEMWTASILCGFAALLILAHWPEDHEHRVLEWRRSV